MKSQEFGAVLKAFADMIAIAGAQRAHDQMIAFAAIFDATPTAKMPDVAKRLNGLPTSGQSGVPSVGDIARLLEALRNFLDVTSKKSSALKDIDSIEPVLRGRNSIGLSAFVLMATDVPSTAKRAARNTKLAATPLRQDLVLHYRDALKASLGNDEEFMSVHRELSSNADMGKGEFVELAKEVAGASARSKPEALKKILKMHKSLLDFKAKTRATGGRSAA
jgi:hypothetical protein